MPTLEDQLADLTTRLNQARQQRRFEDIPVLAAQRDLLLAQLANQQVAARARSRYRRTGMTPYSADYPEADTAA